MKDIPLVAYRIDVDELVKSFSSIQFEHVPQVHNKHADVLATLASEVDIVDKVVDVKVIKKTLRATAADSIPVNSIDKQEWYMSIIQNLTQPSSSVAVRELEVFTFC